METADGRSPLGLDGGAPIAVRAIDLTDEIRDIRLPPARGGIAYRTLACFVRREGDVLGWIAVPVDPGGVASASVIAAAVRDQLDGVRASGAEWTLAGAGPNAPGPAGPGELVSVVVPTCADADGVVACTRTLLERASAPFEVIVVENRPRGSGVRATLREAFGDDERIRYIEEERPGLSHARNAGLRVARGSIIAFIDDDIAVDDHWFDELRRSFAVHPEADCVTGLIVPAELETPAQVRMERMASFGKGLETRVFSTAFPPDGVPLFPYTAGHFGSGANSAFRREPLLELGGFDECLGTGTVARGGEDLDAYIRLLLHGGQLVYEPRAVVWHRHPDTPEALRTRAYGYGVGLGSLIAKHVLLSETRTRLLASFPTALRYMFGKRSRKNAGRGDDFPMHLRLLELAGLAMGPWAYVRSRRHNDPRMNRATT